MTTSAQCLWEAYTADRSPAARQALVLQYLDLVRYVVARQGRLTGAAGRALEQEDMLQYGMLGLLEAIDRFSPHAGVKFETYAIPRIRGAILDEVRNLDWVPRSVRASVRKVEHARDRMVQEEGGEPAEQEVAGRLAMSVDELRKILNNAGAAGPGARSDGPEEMETVEHIAEDAPDPLQRLAVDESLMQLVEAVRALPERSRQIIALHYYEGLKFEEVSRMLKISQSRVSQIHSEVLRDLRNQLADLL